MFKASAVLLLTLVLNVQLCSSAPIPAKAAQSSGPAQEKLTPVTEDHSHFIEEKEPVVDTLISVVAGVAAPSPEESPAEEDIPVIAKEPEPIFIGDQVSDDTDKAYESQESAPQEPLAAASQESSEEGTIHEDTAFAEASPEETTEELAMASAVKSDQHYGEDSAPEVLIPVIPLEASKDEAPEENAEAVERASPEQYVLEDGDPRAPIPIPAGASEDEASLKNAAEHAAEVPLLIVPDDNTEVKAAGLPVTPAEEKSVLVPAELEESAPEEPAVIVPVEPAEQELDQQETVSIIYSQTKEEEVPEEHAKEEEEEEVTPVVLKEKAEVVPATNKEPLPSTLEESVALFPVALETEEEDQVEPVAEQTAPQESAPNDPLVIVPLDPAEEEPELEVQVTEESIPIASPESPEEEAPEKAAEVPVPLVPEENAEEVPATNKEPFPSTFKEEEESIALFPVEFDSEEEGQVEPAPQESSPEDPLVVVPSEEEPELEVQVTEESIPIASPESPEEEAPEKAAGVPVPLVPEKNAEEVPATNEVPLAGATEENKSVVLDTEEKVQVEQAAEETEPPTVSVVVEPTSEEPAPEDPHLIIPLKDLEEDAPDDNTENVVQSDPLLTETALEEDTAGDSDAVTLVTYVTETSSEKDTIQTALDPGEEVAATEVPASTETLTEAPIEPVTAPPAPAVSKAHIVLAPLEGGDGTSMKTRSEDFGALAILTEDEPVVLVNRGTVLGAAFFTQMSFIVTGFLGMTIYKKLR